MNHPPAVAPGQGRPGGAATQEALALVDLLNPADSAKVMANSGITLADCGPHALETRWSCRRRRADGPVPP